MQDLHLSKLLDAISPQRLESYRPDATSPDSTALQTYAWNIALCESLYPSLHCLEVTLRNRIHTTATAKFDDGFWFFHVLHQKEQESLARVSKRLEEGHRKKPLDSGDYVAALNFGFWVSLFNSRYEHGLWPKFHQSIFPCAPRRKRKNTDLLKRLEAIRRFRNRNFHYEPIWNNGNLPEQHRLIMETIGWINPAMQLFAEKLDRFPQIYSGGSGHYHRVLEVSARG